MTVTRPATIRKPDEGRRIGIVGAVYRSLTTREETDGKYATFEALVSLGSGPPPDIHSREEELFFVLEGEMTFQLPIQADIQKILETVPRYGVEIRVPHHE